MPRLKDLMPGGKGDKTLTKSVDPKELSMGIKVEMEHTNDRHKAEEIAKDHLTEDPKYYTKLKAAGLADELDESKVGDLYIEIGEIIENIENEYNKLDPILSDMLKDKNGVVSHYNLEIMSLQNIKSGINGLKKSFSNNYNFNGKK